MRAAELVGVASDMAAVVVVVEEEEVVEGSGDGVEGGRRRYLTSISVPRPLLSFIFA